MPPRGRLYGRELFSPGKICAQIAILQLLHVGTLSLVSFAGCALLGAPWTTGVALSTHFFSVVSGTGWVAISSTILTALATAYYVSIVVGRLKKSVDFCFTTYFCFVLVVWARNGVFPTSAVWWVAISSSFVVTAVLAEYLCVRREMQDISVNDIPKARPSAPSSGNSSVRLRRGDSAGTGGSGNSAAPSMSSSPSQSASAATATPVNQLRSWQASRRAEAAGGGGAVPSFFIMGGGSGLDSLGSGSTEDGGFFVQPSAAGGPLQHLLPQGGPAQAAAQSQTAAQPRAPSGSASDPLFFPFMSPAVLGRGGTITRRGAAAAAAAAQHQPLVGGGSAAMAPPGSMSGGGGNSDSGSKDSLETIVGGGSGGDAVTRTAAGLSARQTAAAAAEAASATQAPQLPPPQQQLRSSSTDAAGGGSTAIDLGATPTGKTSKPGGGAPRATSAVSTLLAWGSQFFH